MAPGTCPGDNFRGTSNNLCTLNLLRLAACTSMYLSLWHSETWGGATHVHESDIWCGFSSTGSSNHNPWHFNYLAQATPDKTTLSLPNLDRLESTPAMPTSVHSNNRIITVHLTPMSGSIYFEAKALRFRLGQTMILGFETLGSNATAENGLFCAWTVHEEHARLLCDATDGLFYIEPLNFSTYVGDILVTGKMDIFSNELLQLGDANGRDKPVIARVEMTYH